MDAVLRVPPAAAPAGDTDTPFVCHDCGEAHRWQPLTHGRLAHCTRCDAVMARGHRLFASSLLALTLAALVIFVVANSADLVTIRLRGAEVATTVPAAILVTWDQGAHLVAVLVALTALVAPAMFILLRLYVLVPLLIGKLPSGLGACMRLLHVTSHWNTVAVLAVGGLLALVRMSSLAQASPGPGLMALGVLALLLAAIESAGLRHLWPPDIDADATDGRVTPRPERSSVEQGSPGRWRGCECCGWVGRLSAAVEASAGASAADESLRCERCGHRLERARGLGLQRTWALLLTAAVMLVPANLLPMMVTVQTARSTPHTLLGGIAELWQDHAWGLATVVFVASIVVPLLKVVALALLAWSVDHAPEWRPLERVRLYRLVEGVGHWSMLDVYVVLLLIGMVRFGNLAGALPGAALLAFAAVVVLTMLATHTFDPRWIWEPPPSRGRRGRRLQPAPSTIAPDLRPQHD